jgi:DNA-binding transcriptional LysR family regulator
VLDGRPDAAFIPGNPRLPGCHVTALWDDNIFIALPNRHALAAFKHVAWDDVHEDTFLVAADAGGPEVAKAEVVRPTAGRFLTTDRH